MRRGPNLELGPANRLVDAVLGTEFSGITDTEVTDKPSLILIFASINLLATDFILPTVTYKLYNPNGWYCIHFSFDIGSHLRVELKKGAHLSESHFDLSVLSNETPIAKDNISILSKSTVITVP